ncbi:MAG: hypothetical protein V4795_06500 [Pseudomonadota bacterium]
MDQPLLSGLTAVLLGCCTASMAGPLADPTRPPAALMAPGGMAAAALPHRANLDTARAIAAAARAADPPAPAAPAVVQAVQLPAQGSAGGTARALVDGKPVSVGDLLDGRTVLAIDAQGLLVKGPRGPERLWLLNGAPKQAAGSITGSASARYQAAPGSGGTSAATSADSNANNSATPTPLSLAGRTTP